MRTEFVVRDETPRNMARAVARYRLRRPAFLVPVAVELVLGGVFAAAGHPGWGVFMAVVALLQPLVLMVQSARMAETMQHRGFQPGEVLAVDWEPGWFEISTVAGSGRYRYDMVAGARILGRAVAMRIRGARVLLVLPSELVPPEARPRLRLPV